MKKIIFIIACAILICANTKGQNESPIRVAVFDPASSGTSIDDGTKVAVREIISSTIVNTGKYSIVERSLLEKIMDEQKFSNSGAVDDMQATEIGKLAGANKVVLSVVTLTGGRNMLSIKIIDVMTATIERQKVKVVTSGELLNVIEPLTLEMLDVEAKSSSVVSVAANNYYPVDNSNYSNANQNANVPSSNAEVIMYGVDYSKVLVIGAHETPEVLARTFAEVNATFKSEPNRFNFSKLSSKKVALYTEPTDLLINTINWNECLSGYEKDENYSIEDMVAKYNLPQTDGMGMVIIAWVLNLEKSRCRYELVYFDIRTRKILFHEKIDTKSKGINLRNGWTNSIYEIIDNKRLRFKIMLVGVAKKNF